MPFPWVGSLQCMSRKAKVDKQTQINKQNASTKNMSSFFCCHALVMLLILCFIFLLGSPAAGEENRLLELSSRDEVVQIAGYGEEKLSTVLVTGSVNCESSSFHSGALQSHAWPIPGVLIGVKCQSHATERKGKAMAAQGVTNDYGDFIVDLPSQLHAIPNLEKICRVKILQIPKGPLCRPTHVKSQKGLRLLSFGHGIRTYSAGTIRLQHSTSKPLHAAHANGQGSREEETRHQVHMHKKMWVS